MYARETKNNERSQHTATRRLKVEKQPTERKREKAKDEKAQGRGRVVSPVKNCGGWTIRTTTDGVYENINVSRSDHPKTISSHTRRWFLRGISPAERPVPGTRNPSRFPPRTTRLSQTQSKPVKPGQTQSNQIRNAECGSGRRCAYRLRPAPAQSSSIRLLLSHPRGLRQEEDRIAGITGCHGPTLNASRSTSRYPVCFPFRVFGVFGGPSDSCFYETNPNAKYKTRVCNGLQNTTM